MKQNNTKFFCQKEHTKKRALERFGLQLNKRKYREIALKIQYGQSTFICSQSNRVKIHKVVYEGKDLIVVYDNKRKSIATLLTPEMLTNWDKTNENSTIRRIIQPLPYGASEYPGKVQADI